MPSDPVKELDKDIDDMANEGRKILSELTPKVAPHAIGTTKVSAENVKFDYDNRGPEYWPARFDETLQRAVTEGKNIGWAWIEMLKHDKEFRDASST